MNDYTIKAYCFNDNARIYACRSTDLVEKARQLHGMWPTSCAALGRFLTASAMMSLMYKAGEHLTFKIDGGGPVGEMIVEASYGVVKGSIHNPEVFMQYNDGHLAVGRAVGVNGSLYVTKDLHLKNAFTSIADLQTGEIGDDFTYYFAASEQTPSAVGVGVLINPDNSCKAAGGFILQILPGCPAEVLDKIEERLKSIKSISEMIDKGMSPEEVISEITEGDYRILDTNPIEYRCDCSKERFGRGLQSLGLKELDEIIEQDGKAEIMCHFCKKKYNFSKEELIKLRKELALIQQETE